MVGARSSRARARLPRLRLPFSFPFRSLPSMIAPATLALTILSAPPTQARKPRVTLFGQGGRLSHPPGTALPVADPREPTVADDFHPTLA